MGRFISRFIAGAILGLTFFGSSVFAKGQPHATRNLTAIQQNKPLLNAVSLSSSKTLTVPGNLAYGFSTLMLWMEYTHDNNGDITIACNGHRVGSSTDYDITACDTSGGGCALTNVPSAVRAVTGDDDFSYRLFIYGFGSVECAISHSAGGANDLITVYGDLIAN